MYDHFSYMEVPNTYTDHFRTFDERVKMHTQLARYFAASESMWIRNDMSTFIDILFSLMYRNIPTRHHLGFDFHTETSARIDFARKIIEQTPEEDIKKWWLDAYVWKSLVEMDLNHELPNEVIFKLIRIFIFKLLRYVPEQVEQISWI